MICMCYTDQITNTDHVDLYEHTIPKMKMQPLTHRKSLPRRWNSKMELQVLNADNKPPNARQMNLQGRETTQGREEAQERKKLERHNEDKEMTDEKKLVQNTLTVQMDVQLLNFK